MMQKFRAFQSSRFRTNPRRTNGKGTRLHTPYEAWCPHCVAARAIRRNHPQQKNRAHIVKDIDMSKEGSVTISMDYMYLHDRIEKYKENGYNPPYLVVVEHRYGMCWAYRLLNKGHMDGAHWLPRRLIQDWDNCGFKEARIILKTDQEPAMTSVQTAVQELRPNAAIPVNSRVGESECNGRVENTIRRVQEKTRALRHGLEHGIKEKLPDDSPVIAWMVRWAAELLSKYAPGDDGKAPYERLRGTQCKSPLVQFGEAVWYLPMKTVRRSKGDPAKLPGIWLGINERTEEVLVGTMKGVVKCRTVSRMSSDKCWDAQLTKQMKGVPWEVVPGKLGIPVPVAIKEGGDVVEGDEPERDQRIPLDDEGQWVPKFRGGPNRLHVSRKAIERYGPTDGCPACSAL